MVRTTYRGAGQQLGGGDLLLHSGWSRYREGAGSGSVGRPGLLGTGYRFL